MEPSTPTLPDVLLFEGQEGLVPNSTFSATASKPSFPLQDHAYGRASEKVYEAWAAGEVLDRPSNSDTEDLLQFLINPNDIYESRSPVASPESDSGISDDPHADPPMQSELGPSDVSATVIYEVICDMGMVEEVTGPDPGFSNALENWTPPAILPEACVMSEVSPGLLENVTRSNVEDIPVPQDPFGPLQLQGLYLTEEEKRLLSEEGVLLCSDLPLTKAEERILKKVRRKIRNKQSAQDSRRRKKEYLDGLESRVAACSVQNQELRKKVQELETHNMSLLGQLQKLQGLIKQTSTKAAQTSTCLVIIIFSLGLLILPSCSSFLGGTQVSRDDYKPPGVISRHILTKGSLSGPDESPTTRSPELPRVQIPNGQGSLYLYDCIIIFYTPPIWLGFSRHSGRLPTKYQKHNTALNIKNFPKLPFPCQTQSFPPNPGITTDIAGGFAAALWMFCLIFSEIADCWVPDAVSLVCHPLFQRVREREKGI